MPQAVTPPSFWELKEPETVSFDAAALAGRAGEESYRRKVVMENRAQPYAANRGFASMDRKKQREIASKGGRASGGNFKNDPGRASAAGRKGGQSVPASERSFFARPQARGRSRPQGRRAQPWRLGRRLEAVR
jgi:general stress protein YciG